MNDEDNLWKCDGEYDEIEYNDVNVNINNFNGEHQPFFTGKYSVGQCVSSFSDLGPRWILYKGKFFDTSFLL